MKSVTFYTKNHILKIKIKNNHLGYIYLESYERDIMYNENICKDLLLHLKQGGN